jgi:hypothetical protein
MWDMKSMATETITIRVDAEAARAFEAASDEERRKLEALLSLQLIRATKEAPSGLREVMARISHNAQERGLTPECLQDILDEA